MTAFNNAWNFLKATPEQQLMGLRGTIPRPLQGRGMRITGTGSNPTIEQRDIGRKDVSRAPFTGESINMDREFGEDAGKKQMAETARLRQEGISQAEKDQMKEQGSLEAARGPADLRQYYNNEYYDGYISPQEKYVMQSPSETELERAARLNMGGGQRGGRMEASSMTGAQRFGSIDKETGESRGRPQIRVKRGNMEGMMTMGRGRGRRGAFNPRTAEALPVSPSQSKPITQGQNYIKLLETLQEKNPNMQINIPTEAELAGGAKEKRPYKSMIDNDELEEIEDQLTNIHGPEMASRIVQSMIDDPQPPAIRTAGVRGRSASDFQGDRPAYRPSTGQFLGFQFDDEGEPKMTSRGKPSMTGISPMDIEQMGRDAMVNGEIDPRIISDYQRGRASGTHRRRGAGAAGAAESPEQAMQEYAQRTGQGLNYTQSADSEGNVQYGL